MFYSHIEDGIDMIAWHDRLDRLFWEQGNIYCLEGPFLSCDFCKKYLYQNGSCRIQLFLILHDSWFSVY